MLNEALSDKGTVAERPDQLDFESLFQGDSQDKSIVVFYHSYRDTFINMEFIDLIIIINQSLLSDETHEHQR